MTTLNDRYPDLLEDAADPSGIRVVRDLEMVFTATAPREVRESIASLTRHQGAKGRGKRWVLPAFPRLRLVAAAVALVAGGLLIAVQQHRPLAVSAETILRKAAAPLPANRAIHIVYREGFPGSITRDETWEETGPRGQVRRAALTSVVRTDGIVTSIDRSVDDGHIERDYEYLPQSDVIRQHSYTRAQLAKMLARVGGPLRVLNIFNGPGVAKRLMALKRRSPQGVHFLGLRHFDGASVYEIHVDRQLHEYGQNEPAMTFYFDARTYVLRGIVGARHPFVGLTVPRTVLIRYEVLPLSAVPPHAFELRPPKGVLVLP